MRSNNEVLWHLIGQICYDGEEYIVEDVPSIYYQVSMPH